MGTYRSLSDLLLLKTAMDRQNISEEDRAVVLDWDDRWKNECSRNLWGTKGTCVYNGRPTTIFGFRVVWREVVVTKKETYST